MGKKVIYLSVLCLGFIVVILMFATHLNEPVNPTIPTTALEESICKRVSVQFGDCKKILLYDTHSNLVFAESTSGIIAVLTNDDFTNFKKFIYPMMDFQEFKEEKVERGAIDWRVNNKVEKDFSIIYGFAEDNVKTIVINSQGNIQPNRFLVRDNLWVWYATFQKEKVKLPVEVTAYDANHQVINGGYGEE